MHVYIHLELLNLIDGDCIKNDVSMACYPDHLYVAVGTQKELKPFLSDVACSMMCDYDQQVSFIFCCMDECACVIMRRTLEKQP